MGQIIVDIFLVIVSILGILTMINDWLQNRKEKKIQAQKEVLSAKTSVSEKKLKNNYGNLDTKSFMKSLLDKLNCQHHDNDDGSLNFLYQGERFWLQTGKESAWVRIIDFQWYECDLDEIEEFSCMQKAINTANSHQSCTAIYITNREDNKMTVYSKCDFAISNELSSPDLYLSAWLSDFFRLKQEVVLEFEKEKQKIGVD